MLYVALCNTGAVLYGDAVPYAFLEQIAGLFILMSAKFFQSFLYAEAESFNSSLNQQYSNYIQKLSAISSWMSFNRMPPQLTRRVLKYEDILWKTFKGNELSEIVSDLPWTLQFEAQYHLF